MQKAFGEYTGGAVARVSWENVACGDRSQEGPAIKQ